jgi:hypothetical protein
MHLTEANDRNVMELENRWHLELFEAIRSDNVASLSRLYQRYDNTESWLCLATSAGGEQCVDFLMSQQGTQ